MDCEPRGFERGLRARLQWRLGQEQERVRMYRRHIERMRAALDSVVEFRAASGVALRRLKEHHEWFERERARAEARWEPAWAEVLRMAYTFLEAEEIR
ncbi:MULTISPECIES: hypothetical protein [unclassified Streptomyces]|uniref:hypothetical protein n=1 Tax=unclassified Streptomyces TaxID=2593676 RepID=UPI0033EEF006